MMEYLNNFLESSIIHGLFYLGKSQTKCTRIIWTFIVATAFVVASYFLTLTLMGFEENYTTTDIGTRSIKDYPFPTVTFYPGDHNSEKVKSM